jgi:hypothetical protein
MPTGEGQGCSTLRNGDERGEVVDACEGGTVSVLTERAGSVGLEDLEAEATQSGEHAGLDANARAVCGEADIAAAV